MDIQALNEKITEAGAFIDPLKAEVEKVIIGQKGMLNSLLIGLLCNGHILLEGVPGLAKTLAIKSLSAAIQAKFSRIQFTPDLLPADVMGTMIYNMANGQFAVKKGPVFANLILADEINRAPAKVQSALLEAMQERQVTIGEQTFPLEEPFLVLATQNPLEQEGTYPLPEAQVDRFLMKVVLGYPTQDEEKIILRKAVNHDFESINPIVTPQHILLAREAVRNVYMDAKIEQYIVDIVSATRNPEAFNLSRLKPLISYGGSPRASISLAQTAKATAFIKHRGYVIPEDVRSVCENVLRHRIGLSYEAEAENITTENIIRQILDAVKVP